MANGKIALEELVNVLAIAMMLAVAQMILNWMGFGGIVNAIVLYIVAIIATDMFKIDVVYGVLPADQNENLPPSSYLTRAGIDAAMVAGGMFLWFFWGVVSGTSTAIDSLSDPQEIVKRTTGVLSKFLAALISHMCLFAFLRFWLNLYHSMIALWARPRGGR